MRGKPINELNADKLSGITPADAGKTGHYGSETGSAKDHPRGCGENGVHQPRLGGSGGSPPRMRGKLAFCNCKLVPYRITPADAGKTQPHYTAADRQKDHPRGCGENLAAIAEVLGCRGSPPRMRGKPLCFQPPTAGNRITPADAGKTGMPFCQLCSP